MSTVPTPDPTPARNWGAIALKYGPWLLTLLTWVVMTVAYIRSPGTNPVPPPPPPIPQASPDQADADPVGGPPAGRGMGWVHDPAAIRAYRRTLPVKSFGDTPAGQRDTIPDKVYLWEAARKVLGAPIPCRNQGQVGACVAFGAAAAWENGLCVGIANGKPFQFREISQEVIYGIARVQIGKGQMRGDDGATGAWGAAAMQRPYGVVPRDRYPSADLTRYNESTCRQFGDRGPPADLVTLAGQHPAVHVAPVNSLDEADRAIASGYPLTIASNQGFTMKRDADGFCRASGHWSHQMACLGYQKGKRPGYWIQNSWGQDAFTGPKGAGDPPDGGFWADARTFGSMIASGECYAVGNVEGWPAVDLDWFVHRPLPRRDRFAAETMFALAP